MSIELLTAIVLGLGSSRNSPFLEEVRKRFFAHCDEIQGADALTYAISDFAFGSHLIEAYARARKDLPPFVEDPLLKRAFKFLLFKGPDPISAMAIALGDPHNWTEHTLLHGLMCTDLDDAAIGKICGLPALAVAMHGQLYFDFRDQGNLFKVRAFNPSLAPGVKPRLDDQQQRAMFLMNLAHTKGPEAVLDAVSLITGKQPSSERELSLGFILEDAKPSWQTTAKVLLVFGWFSSTSIFGLYKGIRAARFGIRTGIVGAVVNGLIVLTLVVLTVMSFLSG